MFIIRLPPTIPLSNLGVIRRPAGTSHWTLNLGTGGLESHKVTPDQTLEMGADPRIAFEWIHALTKESQRYYPSTDL